MAEITATPADSVTVVICAYTERRWQSLLQATHSLRAQRRLPDQCVVVIDHNEQLLRRARTSLPDDVEVLANEERQGLSGARNTGVRAARCDVVAFLDDDAEADPGWLEELLAQYDEPLVMGAGGRAVAVWPGKRPGWMPTEFDWVVGCSYTGLPETIAPVRNLLGAAMSFRRCLLTSSARSTPRWADWAFFLWDARRPSSRSGFDATSPARSSSTSPAQ